LLVVPTYPDLGFVFSTHCTAVADLANACCEPLDSGPNTREGTSDHCPPRWVMSRSVRSRRISMRAPITIESSTEPRALWRNSASVLVHQPGSRLGGYPAASRAASAAYSGSSRLQTACCRFQNQA